MEVKYKELEIADRLMGVVDSELRTLEGRTLEDGELARLEKITKVYTMLMSSTRENIKHNLFAHVTELPDLTEELTDADGDADDDADKA